MVALGTAEGEVLEEVRFPTLDGPKTMEAALSWIADRGPVEALGVAAFGPVRVDRKAADFGTMLATPKPGWRDFSIRGAVEHRFPGLPFALDTDVNAAALAEADGEGNLAYITIGTGIGAGILTGGKLVHGVVHPEFGHWYPRRADGDDFPGVCPFHGDCLEGLASGPAMTRRWGAEPKDLPGDHDAWRFEVEYLAQAVISLLASCSPARVVIGGGVSQGERFHQAVEARVRALSGGYFPMADEAGFIFPPKYGQQAGIRGALLLAGRLGG